MRALLLAAIALIMIEAAALTAGWTAAPAEGEWPIDTLFKDATWATQSERVLFGTGQLASAQRPSIFILGASGAQEAYRPTEWATLLPGHDTHNLAIGGSNITQLDQALDHVIKSTPPEVLARSTLVVGVLYAVFVDDATRWSRAITPEEAEARLPGVTDLERASRPCEILCSARSLGFQAAPPGAISAVKDGYRLLKRLARPITARAREAGDLLSEAERQFVAPRLVRPASRAGPAGAEQPPEAKQRSDVEWLAWYMGGKLTLEKEQFATLSRMLLKARSARLQVFLVDMPLPSWHRNATPYYDQARAELRAMLADPALDFVVFFDHGGSFADTSFRDMAHPNPNATRSWSVPLIAELQRDAPK
jgi:hypothetical protein